MGYSVNGHMQVTRATTKPQLNCKEYVSHCLTNNARWHRHMGIQALGKLSSTERAAEWVTGACHNMSKGITHVQNTARLYFYDLAVSQPKVQT